MNAKLSAQEIINLREQIPAGTRVYTILRKVSASGMQRLIDVVVITDGVPYHYENRVSKLLGRSMKDGSVVVRGVGMDMGFALVYELSEALYNDGYALKQEWL